MLRQQMMKVQDYVDFKFPCGQQLKLSNLSICLRPPPQHIGQQAEAIRILNGSEIETDAVVLE